MYLKPSHDIKSVDLTVRGNIAYHLDLEWNQKPTPGTPTLSFGYAVKIQLTRNEDDSMASHVELDMDPPSEVTGSVINAPMSRVIEQDVANYFKDAMTEIRQWTIDDLMEYLAGRAGDGDQ